MSKSSDLNLSSTEVEFILSPAGIRERASRIFDRTLRGQTHFAYHPDKLKPTVDFVLDVIRKNHPSLNIPYHSRWNHFRAGGVDRVKHFDQALSEALPIERLRAKLDLVVTSVLLDAGAGMGWSYNEAQTGLTFTKSEGLGVASYHMFCQGFMSSDRKSKIADIGGLKSINAETLKSCFQVSEKNPLVAVDGRVQLLNNLAKALGNKKIFHDGRPGNIIDFLRGQYGKQIPAVGILHAVLEGFSSIWPGRLRSDEINLGDVWSHPQMGPEMSFESLVPIHKLSQWMTYSLIEPIEDAGLAVIGVEELTGLAEYRNGGLMLDMGLLTLKNPDQQSELWPPDSPLIIEWRALTIYLLDLIAREVQKSLGQTPAEFPLAKVLEGGTWAAGRVLAQEKRPDGGPPLKIQSDGTVF